MMRQAVRSFLRALGKPQDHPEDDPEELSVEELAQVSESLGGEVQRGVQTRDLEYPDDMGQSNQRVTLYTPANDGHPLARPQSSPEMRQKLDEAARISKEKDKPGRLFKVTGSGLKPVKP